MDAQKKDQNTHRLPPPGKDLESQYPEIAAEWDYERNGDLLPSQVFAHSNKKACWRCKNCGQCWSAVINNRTKGAGCPFDAGQQPSPGQTDLATLRPDLAEEWDYERNGELTPEMFTLSSHKMVLWKCKNCGQSWPATITNRAHGHGCPYDSGRFPITGKTDLATLRPDLAEEWDYKLNGNLKPEMVALYSNKRAWWKCKNCGQRWLTTIENRSYGHGCPYDDGKLSIVGETDLCTLRPDLAEEWDYERNGTFKPEMVTVFSGKRVWWKCKKCGQSWKSPVSTRANGSGCPYDAGKLPIPGKTDLATLRPDLAEVWDYERNGSLTPEMVTVSSGKKVWWICKNCGQSWPATIDNRVRGSGCPYDGGKLPIPGKTDLATLRPDLAEEWDFEQNSYLTPEMVTSSSHKRVFWKCDICGQRWKSAIDSRSARSRCQHNHKRINPKKYI